jgi:tetratricopeptide (TPR) repeat protein
LPATFATLFLRRRDKELSVIYYKGWYYQRVSDLTIGLLSALLATNQPQAVSNLVQEHTGVSVNLPDAQSQEDPELRNIMIADDAALDEVRSWFNTNAIPKSDTNAMAGLQHRVNERFDEMKQRYQTYLRNHPDSARGYLAYGSFLNDIGEEDNARAQYENSRLLDPKNPAVWNQLANYYGEYGGLTNAFVYYAEAIRLDPTEPVYYQNFATTVYLFRKDAETYWGITESQVFDKALDLYRQAMKLEPDNLVLASDYAECYYGIKPLRATDALMAWTNCLNLSKDDNEREGVLLHLARVKIAAGRFTEAEDQLNSITNPVFGDMRHRLERSLALYRSESTNHAPAAATNAAVPPAASAAPAPNPATISPDVLKLQASPPPLRADKQD